MRFASSVPTGSLPSTTARIRSFCGRSVTEVLISAANTCTGPDDVSALDTVSSTRRTGGGNVARRSSSTGVTRAGAGMGPASTISTVAPAYRKESVIGCPLSHTKSDTDVRWSWHAAATGLGVPRPPEDRRVVGLLVLVATGLRRPDGRAGVLQRRAARRARP